MIAELTKARPAGRCNLYLRQIRNTFIFNKLRHRKREVSNLVVIILIKY